MIWRIIGWLRCCAGLHPWLFSSLETRDFKQQYRTCARCKHQETVEFSQEVFTILQETNFGRWERWQPHRRAVIQAGQGSDMAKPMSKTEEMGVEL